MFIYITGCLLCTGKHRRCDTVATCSSHNKLHKSTLQVKPSYYIIAEVASGNVETSHRPEGTAHTEEDKGEEMGVGRKDKGKDKKRTAREQDHIHRKSNKGDEVEETQETNEVKPEPQRFKPSVY